MYQTEKRARNMEDPTMRAVANEILAKCQMHDFTYAEMQTLLTSLELRLRKKIGDERADAANEAWGRRAEIKKY